MAISKGVILAGTRKIRRIEVESVSTPVIKAINEEVYCPRQILTLVKETLEGKKNFGEIVFRYYNRRDNKVAAV